ncbi:MAG: radical SAM protein [Candidatus Lokiarchaeota archaeon]|nr:radical SAM protein [Candidatus Lokiarchaeota archaeon]
MTSKKVCLIQCDFPKAPKEHRYIIQDILFPPLGLEYLAQNIRDLAEVIIIDNRFPEYNLNYLKNEFNSIQPDYVGISVNFSNQIYYANGIAKLAKNYGAKTIMGGWHPSCVPEDTLSYSWTDLIIRGEGEQTFRELIKKGNPAGINGISYKNNGNIIHNPDRKLIDLNNYGLPARDMRPKISEKYYNIFGAPIDCMETSRGCPFSCKFCSIHNFYRHQYRMRSVSMVLQDLRQIKDYNKLIYLVDDNFTADRHHVNKICRAIIKEKISKVFMSTSRLDQVVKHPEMYELMAKAGFMFALVGIESFSDKALEKLNKRLKLKEIKKGIKILHDLGFIIEGGIILGADYDTTKEDLESTLEITKSLDIDIPTFSILTPYPMTDLWDEVHDKGLIFENINWHNFDWTQPLIKYPNVSSEELRHYLDKAYYEVGRFKRPMQKMLDIIKARGIQFFLSTFLTKGGIRTLIKFIKRFYPNFMK